MLRTYRRVRAQVDRVMQVVGRAVCLKPAYSRIFALLLAQSLKKPKSESLRA